MVVTTEQSQFYEKKRFFPKQIRHENWFSFRIFVAVNFVLSLKKFQTNHGIRVGIQRSATAVIVNVFK